MAALIAIPIPPATAAQATTQGFETNGYERIMVCADNLAGAEEVDLFIEAGGTFVALPDAAMTGTAKLTATITALALDAGYRYGVRKDSTVGACGVYVYGASSAS